MAACKQPEVWDEDEEEAETGRPLLLGDKEVFKECRTSSMQMLTETNWRPLR